MVRILIEIKGSTDIFRRKIMARLIKGTNQLTRFTNLRRGLALSYSLRYFWRIVYACNAMSSLSVKIVCIHLHSTKTPKNVRFQRFYKNPPKMSNFSHWSQTKPKIPYKSKKWSINLQSEILLLCLFVSAVHHVFEEEWSEEHSDFAHLIPHVDFSRVRFERQFFHDGAYEVENCLEKIAAMLLLLSENAIYALSLLYEDLQAVTEVV